MKFYEALAKYYDELFKPGAQLVSMLADDLPESSYILDAGCGTGALSVILADSGHDVAGIDLSEEMIKIAQSRTGNNPHFAVGDIMALNELFSKDSFDGVISVGNIIPHLGGIDDVLLFLSSVHSLLKNGGQCIVQIVNADRICSSSSVELPLLARDNVLFKRHYSYNADDHEIYFDSALCVKGSDEWLESRVRHCVLTRNELYDAVISAGFSSCKIYGDFLKSEWTIESPATILHAYK